MSRLTVVVNNAVTPASPLLGEHGLSMWLEHQGLNLLYDTGRGRALLPNLEALNLDPASLDAVVLSHGHYDHSGGLAELLKLRGRPTPVWCHPAAFGLHLVQDQPAPREVGPRLSQAQYEELGAVFHWARGNSQPWPGVTLLTDIPRRTAFEAPAPELLTRRGDALIPDPLEDDLALLVLGAKGPAVLTGCAHAGALNVLAAAREAAGRPLALLAGGTHLGPAPAAQQEASLKALAAAPGLQVAAGHCTGLSMAGRLQAALGPRFRHLEAGRVLEL